MSNKIKLLPDDHNDMINKLQNLLNAVNDSKFDIEDTISTESTNYSSDKSDANIKEEFNELNKVIEFSEFKEDNMDEENNAQCDEKRSNNWNLALQFISLVNCGNEKELKETIISIKSLLNSGKCDVDKITKQKMFNLIGKMMDDLDTSKINTEHTHISNKPNKNNDTNNMSGLEALKILVEECKTIGYQLDTKTGKNITELVNKIGKCPKPILEADSNIFKENLLKLQSEICDNPALYTEPLKEQSTTSRLNELVGLLAKPDSIDPSNKIYEFTTSIHRIFKEMQEKTNQTQKELFKKYFIKVDHNKYKPRLVKVLNTSSNSLDEYVYVPLISLMNQKLISMKEMHVNFAIDADKENAKSKCCDCGKIKVDVSFVASDLPSVFNKFLSSHSI